MVTEKIDTFTYKVQPFDDDFTGRLNWGVLGKHVLAAAESHAGRRGFDKFSRNGHRYLWVLSRMVFEMESWPHIGETYTISTWVRSYYRYFTDRCFDIQDNKGQVIGRVFTIWAMIDATSRKPQPLDELFGSTFNPYLENERPCSTEPFSRIRIKTDIPTYSRTTFYSDIDENDHVNSIRYIEFILDSFPKELFATHQVERLEIAYNTESYSSDVLSFYRESSVPNNYQLIVKKNVAPPETLGEVVCHCAVRFKSTDQDEQPQ